MGLMTTAMVGLGVSQAATSIASGYAASTEAKYNAKIKEQQASMIQAGADMAAYQADRAMGKVAGTTRARVAKSGLTMSGSPMAVLLDTQTQMELDKSIEQYNYQMQKNFATSQAEAYKREGKRALFGGYAGAFQQMMMTGLNVGMMRMNPSLQSTAKTTNNYRVNSANYPSYIKR